MFYVRSQEKHTGEAQAIKYLEGFLEYKNYKTLEDYYMSFFDFNKNELAEYMSIDKNTPEKKINKYINVIGVF